MNNTELRMEVDTLGMMELPKDAYYGIQSLRARENFTITRQRLHDSFISNMALIKKAAAMVNKKSQTLNNRKADYIIKASEEVIKGKLRESFIVDAIQGGAGTSANMNMNEVIANRACELAGHKKGEYTYIHPNDHVNMAQSTNDVIPSAGKLTVIELAQSLLNQMSRLEDVLLDKSKEFDDVIKIGRTQLEDAVPMRLGQTFHGYASMIKRDANRLRSTLQEMYSLNMGGTAIGSGINVSTYYFENIVPLLAKLTGHPLVQADDLFDATQNLDGFVAVSGALKTCAIDLSKMCNDLRLLSSGPRAGLGEINLPVRQNGSSIMPGKVNPVIPEVVSQVAYQVIGNDVTIAMAAEAGQMELNAFEPIVFYSIFQSITSMTSAVTTLIDHCILGITANKERCTELLEKSTGMATALCPYIGYQKSAEVAKKALATGKTIREIVIEEKLIQEKQLNEILNVYQMTEVQTEKRAIS